MVASPSETCRMRVRASTLSRNGTIGVGLPDGVDGRGLPGDGDVDRVVQVLAGDGPDGRRHGRGEQRGLPLAGSVGQDAVDVLGEAHPQHLVGLVQHQELQPGQVERAALEVVDDPAGGADDDLRAGPQGGALRQEAGAAVDRARPDGRAGVRRRWRSPRRPAPRARGSGSGRGPGRRAVGSIEASSGMPKAAVLPVPVCATPVMSRPAEQRRDGGRLDGGRDVEAEVGGRRGAAAPGRSRSVKRGADSCHLLVEDHLVGGEIGVDRSGVDRFRKEQWSERGAAAEDIKTNHRGQERREPARLAGSCRSPE